MGVEGVPASDRGDPGKEELGGELLVFLGGGSFKSAGVSPTFTTMPGAACADGGAAGVVARAGAEWLAGMGAGSVGALVNVVVVVELIPFTPATSAATEAFNPSIAPEFAGCVGAALRADG